MDVRISKKKEISIIGMTMDEYYALRQVVKRANNTCFEEQDEEGGDWFSNDDFVVILSNEEREALANVSKKLI